MRIKAFLKKSTTRFAEGKRLFPGQFIITLYTIYDKPFLQRKSYSLKTSSMRDLYITYIFPIMALQFFYMTKFGL